MTDPPRQADPPPQAPPGHPASAPPLEPSAPSVEPSSPPWRPRWLVELVVLLAGLTLTVFALASTVARVVAVLLTALLVMMVWRAWTLARQRRLDRFLTALTAVFVLVSVGTLGTVAVLDERREGRLADASRAADRSTDQSAGTEQAAGDSEDPAGGPASDSPAGVRPPPRADAAGADPSEPPAAAAEAVWLSELEPVVNEESLQWAFGQEVSLGAQDRAEAVVAGCSYLAGRYRVGYLVPAGVGWFRAEAGIIDTSRNIGSVVLEVYGDTERLARDTVRYGEVHEYDLAVAGFTRLDLYVEFTENCVNWADTSVAWAQARFEP